MDYIKWFPDKQYQKNWIKEYLTEYNQLQKMPPPTQEQVHAMYEEVQLFTLCSNLFWSVWAVIQAYNSDIEFDFLDYAIQRLNEFKRYRNILGV